MKLIDKDALVAEIEKELNTTKKYSTEYVNGKKYSLKKILSFLDTLVVKEADEESVSIDFEQELYKAFGQVKDFTLGMRIAKWFYDMGKNSQEPVSEDFEAEWKEYFKYRGDIATVNIKDLAKHFANWQKQQDQSTIELAEDHAMLAGMEKMKEQMMEKAVDATIGLPYENKDGGYTHLVDVSRPLPVGDNKIAIIFKED